VHHTLPPRTGSILLLSFFWTERHTYDKVCAACSATRQQWNAGTCSAFSNSHWAGVIQKIGVEQGCVYMCRIVQGAAIVFTF